MKTKNEQELGEKKKAIMSCLFDRDKTKGANKRHEIRF